MKKLSTFSVNGILFGIDVLKVMGIAKEVKAIRVPLAEKSIVGLMHFKGQIATVIDLRKKFDVLGKEINSSGFHTIVKTKKGIVSFIVDEIGDVLEINQNTKVEMSKSVQGIDSFFISHTYKFDEFVLLVLDTEKIVEVKSQNAI
ncbi:MAG: chemotaxis protein CheW [Leptospiraceae bacterium]|nr:chemotaxis protein CheW [Leptospiraceae bacterium]